MYQMGMMDNDERVEECAAGRAGAAQVAGGGRPSDRMYRQRMYKREGEPWEVEKKGEVAASWTGGERGLRETKRQQKGRNLTTTTSQARDERAEEEAGMMEIAALSSGSRPCDRLCACRKTTAL